ncbi:hypothetical protein [Flagellimonas onchidii]|uniref:hypothetical protein n=1 Tax=Flagellimonas onchidii TaxID=2562684 RepID=UPI0010A6763C|nr:hypothetical protein [Allomuricauda onchidii]
MIDRETIMEFLEVSFVDDYKVTINEQFTFLDEQGNPVPDSPLFDVDAVINCSDPRTAKRLIEIVLIDKTLKKEKLELLSEMVLSSGYKAKNVFIYNIDSEKDGYKFLEASIERWGKDGCLNESIFRYVVAANGVSATFQIIDQ